MNKRWLLLVIVLLAGAIVVGAQVIRPVYPASYWVLGSLKSPAGGPDVTGYKVVVWDSTPAQGYAEARVGADGKYYLNAFDDLALGLSPEASLKIGVTASGGWGVDPMTFKVKDFGFSKLGEFTLAKGAGIPDPALTEGDVILSAIRDGANLKIIWKVNTVDNPALTGSEPIDIYRLSQDYTASDGWQKILTGMTATQNHLMTGQIGSGATQIYFKGILASTPAAGIKAALVKARAVGKYNIVGNKGFNLIALPFVQQAGNRVQDIIANQLTAGSATSATDNVYNIYYDPNSKTLKTDKASFSGTTWNYTRNFNMLPGTGYWLEINNQPKTVTIVGKMPGNATFTLYEGFNLIGNPAPLSKKIASMGFAAAAGTPTKPGDEIYNYYYDKSQLKTNKASYISGSWSSTEDFKFNPGRGYWYYRPAKGSIAAWQYKP